MTDHRLQQMGERAAAAYFKQYSPMIFNAGGYDPEHYARWVVAWVEREGWLRVRRHADGEDTPDVEAVKARCGPAVMVESAEIEDRKPEEAREDG